MYEYIQCEPDGLRFRVGREALRLVVQDLHIRVPPTLHFFREKRRLDSGARVVWSSPRPLRGFSDDSSVWIRADVGTARALVETVAHEAFHHWGRHIRFTGADGAVAPGPERDAEGYCQRFAATGTMLAVGKAAVPWEACEIRYGRPVGLKFPPFEARMGRSQGRGGGRIPARLLAPLERGVMALRDAAGLLGEMADLRPR